MKLFIVNNKKSEELEFEFVEKKGRGHPDTLADGLAEYLSASYSRYTLNRFNVILHHNFDKVGILGGASSVRFGKGFLTKPIRVLINGRISNSFASTEIPTEKLLGKWTKEFVKKELPLISESKDLCLAYNISAQSSPGKLKENSTLSARPFWFQPRGLQDIPEIKRLVANDTSLGVGYAPYSMLENLILSVEKRLSSDIFLSKNRWIGTDIKILGFRHRDEFDLTICIPQIARFVKSLKDYYLNLEKVEKVIFSIGKSFGIKKMKIHINTRDNNETGEYYLTAIGSSIESGDEGFVGRGNRVNGLISPFRPMSMEGAAGKNPVYHIGKLYYILAHKIAHLIFEKFGVANDVAIASQSGRDLLDPWVVGINVSSNFKKVGELKNLIERELRSIPRITKNIVLQKIKVC